MIDVRKDVTIATLVMPARLTADTSGTVDTVGYYSKGIVVMVGQSGDTLSTSVYWQLVLQHSDDGSTFTNVSSNDVVGATVNNGVFAVIDSNTKDETNYEVEYVGGKRYLKLTIDAVGMHSNGTPFAAYAILTSPRHAPVP